ncbi:MAG: TerB family tellurite resistance protein [Pseudomonadales bacterium]
MASSMFGLIQALFGGGQLSEEKQQDLFAETLFMVLSGATRADLNIESVEVERVKQILEKLLNREYSFAEIKLAGETELYDTAPIQKYVAKASKKLSVEQRQRILHAMVDVFHSDGRMGVLETQYFNSIAAALTLTPAQMLKC